MWFETCDHWKLGEHIRKEHHNIGLESAQDLFRELWESQREGVEGEIVLEQGYGNETLPETVLKNAINIPQDEEIAGISDSVILGEEISIFSDSVIDTARSMNLHNEKSAKDEAIITDSTNAETVGQGQYARQIAAVHNTARN